MASALGVGDNPPTRITRSGTVVTEEWRTLDGTDVLHRHGNQPALVRSDDQKELIAEWWIMGAMGRTDDGPTRRHSDGTLEWLKGQPPELHRTNGPAVIYADGRAEWWEHGRRVRVRVTTSGPGARGEPTLRLAESFRHTLDVVSTFDGLVEVAVDSTAAFVMGADGAPDYVRRAITLLWRRGADATRAPHSQLDVRRPQRFVVDVKFSSVRIRGAPAVDENPPRLSAYAFGWDTGLTDAIQLPRAGICFATHLTMRAWSLRDRLEVALWLLEQTPPQLADYEMHISVVGQPTRAGDPVNAVRGVVYDLMVDYGRRDETPVRWRTPATVTALARLQTRVGHSIRIRYTDEAGAPTDDPWIQFAPLVVRNDWLRSGSFLLPEQSQAGVVARATVRGSELRRGADRAVGDVFDAIQVPDTGYNVFPDEIAAIVLAYAR